MKIGYRITGLDDVSRYPADLVQISYWKRFGPSLDEIGVLSARCREREIPYVLHPVFTPLSETRPDRRKENIRELALLAGLADLGMIVHDEVLPGGKRLSGEGLERYRETLLSLSESCPVSIENATNTGDIDWFWREIGGSITLDLGHFEASGISSVEKIQSLSDDVVERVEYVHLHRNNGEHGGITDHWPLTADCPEVQALEALVKRKRNLSVILEINEMDEVGASLEIARKIRDRP